MRAPAQIITVSLYCQAPGDTKLDLEAGHNLPIEPLFVSDMGSVAASVELGGVSVMEFKD